MDIEGITDTSSESESQVSDETLQNFVDSESSFNPSSLIQPPIDEEQIRDQSTNPLQVSNSTSLADLQETSHSISQSFSITMSHTDSQSSSQQSNNWSNIPKLTSSTFFDWKRRLETTLGARRLSSHILKETIIPTDPKSKADHIVDDLRALEAIQFSCDADNFNVISECTTARAAYLALCKYHDDSGGVTTANLFSELASTRLSSAGELKEHLQRFRNTHTELKGNLCNTPNLTISDPFIAILLLKSLPSEFNLLVQTSLANFETLTLDRIYTLLNMEAKRLTGSSNDSDTALATITNRPSFKGKKKDQVKCSLGHLGHTDEKCRIRIQNELNECKQLLEQQKISSEVAKTAEVSPSYYDQAFISSTPSQTIEVYNTGATCHMSSYEDKFTNQRSIEPRRIGVAAKGVDIWATKIGSDIGPSSPTNEDSSLIKMIKSLPE